MSAEAKLKSMGIEIPKTVAPLASYVPFVQTGNLLFISGQLPIVNGELVAEGKCGAKMGIPQGQEAAKICAINALAAAKEALGSLDRIKRVVKLTGFVNSYDGFSSQPVIINGASDFLLEVFGDKGKHARTAVGVRELPRDATVEIDLILEVE